MKHNCGGELVPLNYEITIEVQGFPLSISVDGFQCDKCDEKLMSRDAALFVESEVAKVRVMLGSVSEGTAVKLPHPRESSTYNTRSVSNNYIQIPAMTI